MDENGKELYMPSGLRMKKEIFPGFTKEELLPSVVACILLIVLDCILFLMGIRSIGLLFFIPTLGTTAVVFLLVKGELNLSPVDVVKQEIAFSKSQKFYPYIAGQEWESSQDKEKESDTLDRVHMQ